MKYATCITILGLFMVASATSDSTKKPQGIFPMEAPSVTRGTMRITLLHLARTISWSNEFVQKPHDGRPGPMCAIPGVYLEFLVEQLDELSTDSGVNYSTIEYWQNGHKISEINPFVPGGGDQGIKQYNAKSQRFGFTPPMVENETEASILWSYDRCVTLESGKVTIRFEAGFMPNKHSFVFDDIPLY